MSLVTTKIENCPTYHFDNGGSDVYIFGPGIGELQNGVNGKAKGIKALLLHGQPKFFNAAWPKCQIFAVQLPNQTLNLALLDSIVTAIKALPNVGSIYATGLSMGAILWAKYLCSDAGARAAQFKGCFLMSGNGFVGTKAANFKNMKMVLFSGSEALDKTVSPKNYESIYPVYKKAGVDISYTLLNEGHNDNVWNHFSPLQSPAIYKGFSTVQPQPYIPPIDNPLPPIVETTDMQQVIKINGDYSFTKSAKRVLYANKDAGANISLPKPADAKGFEIEVFRNKWGKPLTFSETLWYGNDENLNVLSDAGTFCICFDDVEGRYYIIHY